LSIARAQDLAAAALAAKGACAENARSTAAALVAADVDGQTGHGLGRIPSYAAQLTTGKINGAVRPVLESRRPAAVLIDARGGFAYPALDLAVTELPGRAAANGVAAATLFHSHHIGQAGRTAERLADQGLVALIVSNTPSAMAFWGGITPQMGTNPLAFAAPLPGREALVIDLALTRVARSRILAAQKKHESIPLGWATDAEGLDTTDPTKALKGALAPAGGAKGAALAMMIEVLCAALAGGRYGWEASSFLDDKGGAPGVGQLIIAFHPEAFGGDGFLRRMGDLAARVGGEPGARLPGDRRLEARARAARQGVIIESPLLQALQHLAKGDPDQ
jgi:(2R)-3-sulfolactate dehydrogenase (NADP+)